MSEEDVKKTDSEQQLLKRMDGWINALTGLGKRNYDKTEETFYIDNFIMDDEQMTDLYKTEGLASRIIDVVPEDATRRWFEVANDENGRMTEELTRLNLRGHTAEAMKWTRLYGGAAILMMIDDGRQLTEPVNTNSVKKVDFLRVYPRPNITIAADDFNDDPDSPFFEDLESMQIQNINGDLFRVHRSRVILFKGKRIPRISGTQTDRTRTPLEDWFWGVSIMWQLWNRIRNLGASEKGLANIMQEFVIGIFKISNLSAMLESGREDELYTRMDIIQAAKSVLNAVLLGEGEEFDRNTASVAGAADIMQMMMLMVSGITGIPLSRLFGQAPSGLSTDDENGTRTYYDSVAAKQHTVIEPTLMPLLSMVGGYTGVPVPQLDWFPLLEPTEKEKAEVKKINAETDKLYVEMGVLDSVEVREQRFVGGYSSDIVLEDVGSTSEDSITKTEPKVQESIKRVQRGMRKK